MANCCLYMVMTDGPQRGTRVRVGDSYALLCVDGDCPEKIGNLELIPPPQSVPSCEDVQKIFDGMLAAWAQKHPANPQPLRLQNAAQAQAASKAQIARKDVGPQA